MTYVCTIHNHHIHITTLSNLPSIQTIGPTHSTQTPTYQCISELSPNASIGELLPGILRMMGVLKSIVQEKRFPSC